MTDHANELRRYSRKIGHPAGDVPSVMLAAADEIERLAAMLEAAEKERDECNRRRLEAADHFAAQTALMKEKYDDLRAKIEATEKQEPVAWTTKLALEYGASTLGFRVSSVNIWGEKGVPLYALPGAQSVPSAPDAWLPVPDKHPTFDPVDLQLADGSVLCGCVPQSDGDYWWEGPSGEVFIDPKYANVTHWRLAAAALVGVQLEAKP